jgi:hypothetical protein
MPAPTKVVHMSVSQLNPKQGTPRFIDPNAPLAKQQEIFKLLMKDPPENSRVITITPSFADWLLDTYNTNTGNRKRKPARIRRYAEAMERDDWLLTGEPLIFARNKLLDGQNRLLGCVSSNKSFKTYVVFGIDENVFTAINSGASRKNSDAFYIAGVPDYNTVSGATRWLMIYALGDPEARLSFSSQEAWAFYKEKVDAEAMARAVLRAKGASKTVPHPTLTAHFYLFEKKSVAITKKLATDFDKNKNGARRLTQVLAKARKENGGRLNDIWINALIVQVWNAYRENRSVVAADLKYNGAMEYPKIS